MRDALAAVEAYRNSDGVGSIMPTDAGRYRFEVRQGPAVANPTGSNSTGSDSAGSDSVGSHSAGSHSKEFVAW